MHPMRDDQPVTDLVLRASAGDKQAWDALVERYAPLVWSICCRYRLGAAEAQDAGQSVWLHLVEQLGNLRDPDALPRWLATTTRLECARVLRAAHGSQAAVLALDAEDVWDDHAEIAEQQLLAAEQHVALRQAFASLPPRCQQLITLLIHDPPMPSAQISATLGVSAGNIGSMRRHCLHELRSAPAIAALLGAEAATTPGQQLRSGDGGLDQFGDPFLHGGAPVQQRVGDRPHVPVVKVGRVLEAQG
jgi:RNA polymerase sigma factor (sigma-70 family)